MRKQLLMALCLLTLSASAQTKEATEKWILEKLNRYNISSTSKHPILDNNWTSYDGYSFSFNQYYLVVKYSGKAYNGYSYKNDTKYTCIEKIPIYDITSVSTSGTSLLISTNKKTIIRWCEGYKNDYVSGLFSLGFSSNSETDLEERLNKAFMHLKKFYKKPQSTETF